MSASSATSRSVRATIFLEVHPSDSSDFEEDLVVRGVVKHGYRVLQVTSGNVPNTIAAVLLEIRDVTGVVPDDLLRVERRATRSRTCSAF